MERKVWKKEQDSLNEMIEHLDAHAISGATPQITFGDQFEMPIPQKLVVVEP